jgi:hypothetical protein
MPTPFRPLLAVLMLVAFAGCDSSDAPEDNPLAGRYVATEFLLDEGAGEIDVLAAGGGLAMTLRADDTVSGLLSIPEELAGEDGGDISFGGTYSVDGDRVQFQHETDTFVRDLNWTYADETLRAEGFGLSVVLARE